METWTPLIIVHTFAASYSTLFGLVQLARRKGDPVHRLLGRIWIATMLITCTSSFGIRRTGSFGPPHLLSAWTLCTVIELPTRRLPRLAVHQPLIFAALLLIVVASVACVVAGTIAALSPARRGAKETPRAEAASRTRSQTGGAYLLMQTKQRTNGAGVDGEERYMG